jgi:6-phosphogluconolactonase
MLARARDIRPHAEIVNRGSRKIAQRRGRCGRQHTSINAPTASIDANNEMVWRPTAFYHGRQLRPRQAAFNGRNKMSKSLFAIASVAMIAALAPRGASADTFAYVANADSNDISVFHVEPASGAVKAVETVAFPGVEKPGSSTPLAMSPDRRFLFAGVRSEPYTVLSFAIDAASGRLTFRGRGGLADSMANIATERSGKFLFSASYGGNKVAINPIGADGVVGEPKQVIPTGLNAHAFLPSPDNHFVFATNLGSDQILSFRFDAVGATLTPNDPAAIKVAEKNGPRHFVFHPNGRSVYLVNELSAALLAFSYDAARGTWQQIQQSTALPEGSTVKPWAADLHLTPDGRFLYASERNSRRSAPSRSIPTAAILRRSAPCRPRSSRAALRSIHPATC